MNELIRKEQVSSADEENSVFKNAQSMSDLRRDVLSIISDGFDSDVFNFNWMEWYDNMKKETSPVSKINSENPIINTNLSVMCLQSCDELKRNCEKMGLKFVDCSDINTSKQCFVKCLSSLNGLTKECEKLNLNCYFKMSHKVDVILNHRVINGKTDYLVQWKNYNYNTWESDKHISGCQKLISYNKQLKGSSSQLTKVMFVHFLHDLVKRKSKPYDVATFIKLCSLIEKKDKQILIKDFETLNISTTQLREQVKKFFDISPIKLKKLRRDIWKIMQFGLKRKFVLITLKRYEKKINSDGAVQITIENNVDLEGPPNFKFLSNYIINKNIEIVEEPVTFCSCKNCHKSKDCCPIQLDGQWAYDRYGRVQLNPGRAIYECNSKCKCGISCYNRVVQHGQKVKVGIFKTSNGRGWGLKTLESIAKGQFVMEYLGEIITTEEAEKRDLSCDNNGCTYLFDLDFGTQNCKYTIDARHRGNASHFMNHSCDPNLQVFVVWIEMQVEDIPRLAFFAKKKINRGEELTFDYKMTKSSGINAESFKCLCNEKKCRGSLAK
ncbi:histone-lysine N-methyltransferase SUV39H2 [Caerostris darwini]|uniref:Histone-lysine N-methyltransferase SUV39H2 n=1 Tax=Caerostris darwini TaxID=1538125 RepID=A0AAV4WQ19_9ARAC|nr:histone-lysine N-methyltransferase SUV39H2 [Caerostris darwini]